MNCYRNDLHVFGRFCLLDGSVFVDISGVGITVTKAVSL